MKIFINPGHGGTDPGAVSKTGTKESEISATIGQELAEKLRLNGYTVEVYQQKKDYFEISRQENKSGADLFISIHCNSSTSASAHGIETLYLPTSTKGKKVAEIMQRELVQATKLTDRGIKAREDLHVLKRTTAPAILIECGFISNPKEEALLKSKPNFFANAIFEGIKKVKNN